MSCATAVLLAEKESTDARQGLVALVINGASLCHCLCMGVPLEAMPLLAEQARLLLAKMDHPSRASDAAWQAANPGQALDMIRLALTGDGDTDEMGQAARCLRALARRLEPALPN